MTDKQIVDIIQPIVDNLQQGAVEVNAAKHSRDFSTALKSQITQSEFEQMMAGSELRGELHQPELVALFRRSDSLAAIWKQTFAYMTDEFVLEVVFIEQDDKVVVDHCLLF